MRSRIETFRAEVRAFAEKEIAPFAEERDRKGGFPRHLWRRLGETGLLGLTVPRSLGGAGRGYLEHTVAMEEISRADGGTGLAYAAHSNLCVDNLYRFGNAAQRARYLPELVSGKSVGALAMSEPEAGSDVLGGMRCRAVRRGDQWIATGTKKWITNGPEADILIVYMRTGESKRISRSVTAFILEDGQPGFRKGEPMDKLGMRSSGTCELHFDECAISGDRVLGEVSGGVAVLMSGLDSERLVLTGGPIGLMQAALDLVLPHLRERQQFGRPLGDFQLMQARVADMYTALEAARSFAYRVAGAFDRGSRSGRDAAACYLFAAEAAVKTALAAIQCLGGPGYLNGSSAGRLLRDAKLYEIGGGTSEMRRIAVARDLLNPGVGAEGERHAA
ncbi:MAG: acyl-CoA dehydrogenase family protein [Pseudomonadota bacterium]|nr:acyl-CoA dehydrogenase family protein [Pseudomonadota bacterium]